MREKWTGELIGKMHNANVTRQDLADELGQSKAYVTMILNGERSPEGAMERLTSAFNAVIRKRGAT